MSSNVDGLRFQGTTQVQAKREYSGAYGVMPQAGGSGSTGTTRVLDICPEKVHQRVPLFVGSKGEVDYLETFFDKE